MGSLCGGGTATTNTRETAVDAEIQEAKAKTGKVKKILFLGPGGGGKSTLFKQVRRKYGSEFSVTERTVFKQQIHQFIVEVLQHLLRSIGENDEASLPESLQEAARAIERADSARNVDMNALCDHIRSLWADQLIQVTFEEEAKLKSFHTCRHFIDDLDRIAADDYVPTDQDILWQRRPTTGLIQQKIEVSGKPFTLIDVGGQKNERRKWEHQFDGVNTVIFVVSLSSFDEPMYEDEQTNAMEDALQLFEDICKSAWFKDQNMILFLNKEDLFKEKIEGGSPIKNCAVLESYDGSDTDCEASKQFIIDTFTQTFSECKKGQESTNRQLYTFVTCAYDEESVQDTFSSVIKMLQE